MTDEQKRNVLLRVAKDAVLAANQVFEALSYPDLTIHDPQGNLSAASMALNTAIANLRVARGRGDDK